MSEILNSPASEDWVRSNYQRATAASTEPSWHSFGEKVTGQLLFWEASRTKATQTKNTQHYRSKSQVIFSYPSIYTEFSDHSKPNSLWAFYF